METILTTQACNLCESTNVQYQENTAKFICLTCGQHMAETETATKHLTAAQLKTSQRSLLMLLLLFCMVIPGLAQKRVYVYIHDTIYKNTYLHDTIKVTSTLHDTVKLNTVTYLHDTVKLNTVTYLHDTVKLNLYDTSTVNKLTAFTKLFPLGNSWYKIGNDTTIFIDGIPTTYTPLIYGGKVTASANIGLSGNNVVILPSMEAIDKAKLLIFK